MVLNNHPILTEWSIVTHHLILTTGVMLFECALPVGQ